MLELDNALNLVVKGLESTTKELGFKVVYPDGVRPPEAPVFKENNSSYISYTNYSLIDENSHITNENVGVHYEIPYEFIRHLQKGCHINGCTVMFKKDVYKTIGEFNTRYKYTQDYDYWLRVIQQYRFDYINKPLTLYRVHPKMGSKQYLRNQTAEIIELRIKYKRILKDLERSVLM